jgi:DNA-binding transcriptional LysR family regulator
MTSFEFRNGSTIDVRHLAAFLTLYEERHFGRAARRLGILQPQLTLLIQRLEDVVGHQLFIRRPSVIPTAAAEAFADPARRAVRAVDEGLLSARNAAAGRTGLLNIGYPSWIAATFVPDVIAQFRKSFSGVAIQLRSMSTVEQIAELRAGRLDVAFLRDVEIVEGCVREEIFSECWLVAMPRGHAKASHPTISAKDLDGEQLVASGSFTPWLQSRLDAVIAASGSSVELVQEAGSWYTILSLVRSGTGVAVIPESQANVWHERIVYVPFDAPGFVSSVCIFYNQVQTPALANFIDEIRRFARLVHAG